MKQLSLALVVGLLGAASPSPLGAHDDGAGPSSHEQSARGGVVVTNRAEGSITVINPHTDTPITYPLPAGDRQPEPMYVVDAGRRRVLVGDRANNRVVVFDARTFRIKGTIPAGNGVFHMWAGRNQVWVINDVDNTSTVIDLDTLNVIETVPMPADLVALGGRPHDVVLDPHHGRYAYVTMFNVGGPSDYVVKFSTVTFREVGRAAVGKSPHVAFDDRHEQVFVPCQGSNALHVLDASSLETLSVLSVPGAHGAAMGRAGRLFYTTNLPGGGVDALSTIDARTRTVIGEPLDAPFPAPHNIAVVPGGRKLYVTHSEATSNQVTVYRLDGHGRPINVARTVTTGLNPFGIVFVR